MPGLPYPNWIIGSDTVSVLAKTDTKLPNTYKFPLMVKFLNTTLASAATFWPIEITPEDESYTTPVPPLRADLTLELV